MKQRSIWDEDPRILKRLRVLQRPQTMTNTRIAEILSQEFGVKITRNSVIGKCARMGIKGKPRDEPKKARREHVPKQWVPPKPVAPTPIVVLIPKDAPIPKGDVDEGCRWLHGEAAERNFCGCEIGPKGGPWCAFHETKAWAPITESQSRKSIRQFLYKARL